MNMIRKFGLTLTALAAFMLSACGSDSPTKFSAGAGTSSSGTTSSSSSSGGPASTARSITMISSTPQIPSNNSTSATVTAIVKDANNAIVANAPVTFSTTSGVIAPVATSVSGSVAGETDTAGQAQATVTTPGDPSNRTITVTATVGTVSQTLAITVVGSQLSLSGPTNLITGANGTFSASLVDSGGVGVANTAVTLTSANGNTLSSGSLTTDNTGHITFTVTGSHAGQDTITAAGLGLSATAPLFVSGQSFNLTVPASGALVALNASQPVTLVWTNNGAPVANTLVSFSTTRGSFIGGSVTTTATTDSTGTASVALSATTAGPALITASANQVSSQVNIQFVATTPARVDVQASPANVPTAGKSTITAIVWDAQDNLVQGQTVDFQLTDKTGGSISVATAVTNSQGVAQTVYQATSASSSAGGVVITATVQSNTAINKSVNLTVGGQTLFLSLGTGNLITAITSTQFSMPWTVQALDSSGNSVTGVTITFAVHSFPYSLVPTAQVNPNGSTSSSYAAYFKGQWAAAGTPACNGIAGTAYCQIIEPQRCLNEDVDGSGILHSPSEDTNGNGRLDPGDVASVSPGSAVTDSTGTASVTVLYPQDHSAWVQSVLTASASVQGTESSTSATFVLPILATDINTAGVTPPGFVSPYGVAATCVNPN